MTDSTRPLTEPPQPDEAESSADASPEPRADAEAMARQRDDYYDQLLRKTAEFDNYRKRVERERQEQAEAAAADVLLELLQIVDDLERALEAATDDDANANPYREGVELIHKQLLDLLAKRGVRPIESVGQPFDPHVHQAVAGEISTPEQDGLVLEEFRRGYVLGDRLLRAAMVKVATT